ncbi:uncharacterized protein [Anabrus simplex]|uniref:uncharacterized protein n=1 Tax=Anabrus simplex TaxID=316456 RepID=UPI0035A2D570
MNTAIILLICGTIAFHSCKGYDGVIPVNAEDEEEEESMSAEIVRQMYESVPWSALSNKSAREALHTLTEFVTSREARSLVRNFVLDVWSEREDEDDVDFLTSFLHFLGTVSQEAKVWQATRRILAFLQSSPRKNDGTDLAQQYDENFLGNIDNFLEQNDIFNKEEQDKDDYKEYAEQVIERNGILKTYDIHKILRKKTVNENLVEEDTHAANDKSTAWTDTTSSTQPAISTTDNLSSLNKRMKESPEINKIDKSSDMEIIIKLKDKPLGQINVEVKHEEEHTQVTTQTNMHAKDKDTGKHILATAGNVGVKQAKDKSRKENARRPPLPVQEEDRTSIPFLNLAERQDKEDVAVTPFPTCPLVTEMANPGKITAPVPKVTHKRHSAEQLPCETQEPKLQEWEKVAFLSLIRAIILKENYKLCQNTSGKISQSTLPPSPRETWESNTSQVTDTENTTLPHLQTEYSLDAVPNYVSVSARPDTRETDNDISNKSMPSVVTSIRPDTLKVNDSQDLNTYMNFFSKLIHQIPNDSVTSSDDEITTGGNNQPLTPPSQSNSTEHVSTSTPIVETETVPITKVSEATPPQVTTKVKDNLQDFFYVLKNLPMEPFKSIGEDRGLQPSRKSSNVAAEMMNQEDLPGPFISNIEPVLIYRTQELAGKQKPRQHYRK